MKKLHPPGKPIIPAELYTKSEYARKIGVSPTWVEKLIEKGEITVVSINGNELIKAPAPAAN